MLRALTTLAVIAVALLLLLTSGCHRAQDKASEEIVPQVKTVAPHRQTIVREVKQPGTLRAYEQTPIYAKIPGFVESVNVDSGDTVKKGDLLAKLRVPEMGSELLAREARVKQAEADLQQAMRAIEAAEAAVNSSAAGIKVAEAGQNKAEAERKRWEAEVVRANGLLVKNVYDSQTRDEAVNQAEASVAAVREAQAKVLAANALYNEAVAKKRKAEADENAVEARVRVNKAEVQNQKDWLNYAELRAPYDGIVTQRNIHTEHFVQSTTSGSNSKSAEPLFMVMRTDIMRVTVQVPERDAVLIKQAASTPGTPLSEDGSPAVVRIHSLPGRQFLGAVTRDSWSFDPEARTLRAEVHLKNTDGALHVNMYADVVITTQLPDALVLPAAAVLTDGNQDYCFQVKDGKAVRMLLQLGVRTEDWVQVFAKQEPNAAGKPGPWTPFSMTEAIIVSNPGALIDGQKVRMKDEG